jgi:threonylcarbamoyladenosine tRNA methylthiotransferase MtaB
MLKFGVILPLNGKMPKIDEFCKKSCTFVPVNKTPILYMIDTSAFQGKTAAYYTLGCKLNFSETSTFGKMLQELGVRTVQKGERADICLINTCSVTEVADKKCRQQIHRMVRENPGAFVVVTGCYAQLEADEVAKIDGVSLVLGSDEKANLVQFLSDAWAGASRREEGSAFFRKKTKDIKSFAPSCSRGNRTRYFLKVQDGCDYFCTYCTIPYARGFSRNPSIESLVAQASEAAQEGGKEIVLTGVNIGDFGKTTGEQFIDLVKALDRVEPIQRYRISSLEPDLLTDELITYCAQSRAFMPHFHIPLQSGSDTVLKLMHRHYDRQLFADKIHRIKELMPDAFIGVDVMVGCRGETPECFEETYEFLKGLDVTQLHVFPYSERPGTSALKIPYVVSEKDKKLRSKRLLDLSDEKTIAFYEQHIGQEAEVLFEKATRGRAMHGFTRNYIRVELSAKDADPALDNQLVKVRLGELTADKQSLKALL